MIDYRIASTFFALISALSAFVAYVPDIIDGILMPQPPLVEKSSGQPRQWGTHMEAECNADDGVSTTVPYKLHVEDSVLADLHDRLSRWRPPGAPMEHGDGWSFGVDSDFMTKLSHHWQNKYNWRKYEAQLNAVGLNKTVVDGLNIMMHNIRRGEGKKAILLLHGWPGSIWEFNKFIQMILSEKALAEYSIVCPSLPGYGFSDAPAFEGYNVVAMAGTMQRLMAKLGYDQYIIQAGDWGSAVAQAAAYLDPSPLIGLHLNFFPLEPSPGHFILDEINIRLFDDRESQARARQSKDLGAVLMQTGYLHQQATKPETLGYSLSDSPVGLCAWLSEKFQSWSDLTLPIEEKFSMDDLLTNCMIYWVTNSITSSMRLYKEQFRTTEANAVGSLKVNVPVALSLFPYELFPPADLLIKRKFTEIKLLRKHQKGGHFAALEQPELLVWDLVEFVKLMEKKDCK